MSGGPKHPGRREVSGGVVANAAGAPNRFRAPAALQPGACIALVAPSSPFDHAAFDAGVARLAGRYRLRFGPTIEARHGYLAGDDERRVAELCAAIDDPEVRAIVAVRGGYGATRLLPDLDIDRIRRSGSLLVGLSDITALHAAWARAGLRSLHGPMVASLGTADDALFAEWVAALEGAPPRPFDGLAGLCSGVAEGPLLGGNLSVLVAMVGTPFAPPIDGAVLFLEDVGERPYRVDRMLTTLHQAGWFRRVAGVVAGAFTEATPGADGVTVEQVLRERLGGLQAPVALGLPVGHIDPNPPLPLGTPVRLDADGGRLEFLGGAVEHPAPT